MISRNSKKLFTQEYVAYMFTNTVTFFCNTYSSSFYPWSHLINNAHWLTHTVWCVFLWWLTTSNWKAKGFVLIFCWQQFCQVLISFPTTVGRKKGTVLGIIKQELVWPLKSLGKCCWIRECHLLWRRVWAVLAGTDPSQNQHPLFCFETTPRARLTLGDICCDDDYCNCILFLLKLRL